MVALLVIDRRSQLPKLPCRYLLRGVVMGYLNSRFPKWAAVDAALSSEGWKLVTLLRLSPVVPWNVLNYALSVTGKLAPVPCVLPQLFYAACCIATTPSFP